MAPALNPDFHLPDVTPAFLAAAGWAGAEVAPLAADLSYRRYFRVTDGTRRAVLMDAPPGREDTRPFLAIARHLTGIGLSAPAILAADTAAGLLLLEDFGDRKVTPALAADPSRETEVYAAAVDVLTELGRHAPPPGLIHYDERELRRELAVFADWWAAPRGIATGATFDAAWAAALAHVVSPTHPVLTLRDYHADNLMLLDRPGVTGLGLLDFQDALVGHAAYDLVSLLQDCRRVVLPALEAAMLARFIAATGADDAAFRVAYAVLGAQRDVKILGVFSRSAVRDGKAHYLPLLPLLWDLIERDLAHPALADVAAWFAANVPGDLRA